jgi:tRNA(Ile)-lysidine synthase
VIKLQGRLPREICVAVSGGVDSMVALEFLRKNHDVTVLYFNHGTHHGVFAEQFVGQHCLENVIPCVQGSIENPNAPSGVSQEEHWRNERYRFFKDRADGKPVITAHHLDDCVETWIWSSLHGYGRIIPYSNDGVIRPFRMNRKRDLELWASTQNISFIQDDSNGDLRYTRNYIRHQMMPHVLKVNPGIYKTVKKKVVKDVQ